MFRVAIVGMGGFAASHHQVLLELEKLGQARLVATCDPHAGSFAEQRQQWRMEQRGVRVFDDYETMLEACAEELDVVVIATPISLHAPMHAQAVARGLSVYLEKPPTLSPAELEAMIATDKQAPFQTLVGFNPVVEARRKALCARLAAGEFGRVREARLFGYGPRSDRYYSRNNWAGRLCSADGRLLMDSCLANAMAHYVHNLFFWIAHMPAGSWPQIAAVRSELYRAHPIQGPDTFFVSCQLTNGVPLRLALTHACVGDNVLHETLITERARIDYINRGICRISWNDGRTEQIDFCRTNQLLQSHLDYYAYLRGELPAPVTSLEQSRTFVQLNGLCYLSSAGITDIEPRLCHSFSDEQAQVWRHVGGLRGAMWDFLEGGNWPSASNLLAQRPLAEEVGLEALPQLEAVIREGLAPVGI